MNTNTPRFKTAVAAFRAWDAAIDAYLADPEAGPTNEVEQAAYKQFESAFARLCLELGVYQGVPAHRHSEDAIRTAVEAEVWVAA